MLRSVQVPIAALLSLAMQACGHSLEEACLAARALSYAAFLQMATPHGSLLAGEVSINCLCAPALLI